MSKYKWLLDAGHGGLTPDGRYTTAPAKMHTFDDVCDEAGAKVHGFTFYEGVNNRAIIDKLVPQLLKAGYEYELMHDHVEDTPLPKRVEKANRIYALDHRCIYLSIHSDAMPDGAHGKGSGFSFYTSKGDTQSDAIAQIFSDTYRRRLKQAGDYRFKFRKDLSDGDDDFEENFYVLRKTNCPAVLIENLFFDNRTEAEFLLSDSGRQQIADALFLSILYVENRKMM